MFIVGLTGGLATGKSTVLATLKENGVAVINADEVSRKVLEPGSNAWFELKDYFGDEILHSDRRVNRAKLGEMIFNNVEKRQKLNSITHPKIQSEMLKIAMSYFFTGHQFIVMEVPLLFETRKMLFFMHKIITVVCSDRQQLQRLCERNHFTEAVAMKRIRSQMPLHVKVAKSDYVIDNSGDLTHTQNQTLLVIEKLKKSRLTWYIRSILMVLILSLLCAVAQTVSNMLVMKQ